MGDQKNKSSSLETNLKLNLKLNSNLNFKFQNTYTQLPDVFYERINPTKVKDPKLVLWNTSLAQNLQAVDSNLSPPDPEFLAQVFSGNILLPGSEPISQVYAGHQFGHFVPQLGDGRAILLGEVLKYDLQLKGSGRTRFSRGGDGRAPLGPMIREYLVSEYMHSIGIPTTRSLALVSTGEFVQREQALPGAILTRVSSSHIRVGTFEYFASKCVSANSSSDLNSELDHNLQSQNKSQLSPTQAQVQSNFEHLKILANYTIQRHYPELWLKYDKPSHIQNQMYFEFLISVIKRQAKLIAKWMSNGFIHGVMNTDNMTLSGETIDYGPCAFMDYYNPDQAYSFIDKYGRYRFSNQPQIAKWNLSLLGSCLLPLITTPELGLKTEVDIQNLYTKENLEPIQYEIDQFEDLYNSYWIENMKQKIGLKEDNSSDKILIKKFLALFEQQRIDFTLGFRFLSECLSEPLEDTNFFRLFRPSQDVQAPIQDWVRLWLNRINQELTSPIEIQVQMNQTNPNFIPRNHVLEKVIYSATYDSDFKPTYELLETLLNPFQSVTSSNEKFHLPPKSEEIVRNTFCGT